MIFTFSFIGQIDEDNIESLVNYPNYKNAKQISIFSGILDSSSIEVLPNFTSLVSFIMHKDSYLQKKLDFRGLTNIQIIKLNSQNASLSSHACEGLQQLKEFSSDTLTNIPAYCFSNINSEENNY